ncbi:hypothetical protein [Prosthecobacter sp.]|uniref:hypothetical protein n=1 Tax=Prosthecobacter sp. TaxID=1965333 RepID=UPI003783E4CF
MRPLDLLMALSATAALLVPAASQAEIPALFRKEEFNAATLAQAVNHFVDLGEADAAKELAALAPDRSSVHHDKLPLLNVALRVSWVCRILFEPRGKTPLRPPQYGRVQNLPWLSMPPEKWPLYPVVASGKSYFVLGASLEGSGIPEDPLRYLDYCRKAGRFRTTKVPVPDRAQAQADVILLRQSAAWQALRWTDKGPGISYGQREDWVWDFIQPQADGVP